MKVDKKEKMLENVAVVTELEEEEAMLQDMINTTTAHKTGSPIHPNMVFVRKQHLFRLSNALSVIISPTWAEPRVSWIV